MTGIVRFCAPTRARVRREGVWPSLPSCSESVNLDVDTPSTARVARTYQGAKCGRMVAPTSGNRLSRKFSLMDVT